MTANLKLVSEARDVRDNTQSAIRSLKSELLIPEDSLSVRAFDAIREAGHWKAEPF